MSKKDFPIFRRKLHGYPLTYLDSAATTQKPQTVIDAISAFYEKSNANVKRGIYPLAGEATAKVEGVREKVARFISAKSTEEIIFVRNATEAINLVASSMSHNIFRSDIIVTTIIEHHSNFVPWQMLAAKTGAYFNVISMTDDFQFNLPNFSETKVLAITHVSNVLGVIVDVERIIKKARKQNPKIIVIVDAAQAVAHMPVDVQKLDCDFLAFSGHKLFAGMGVGVLYGKRERLQELDPFLFGGQMIEEVTIEKTTFRKSPDKFEAGTLAAADILSLGAALDYIESIGFDRIQKHEKKLTSYALERLKTVKGLQIIGPQTAEGRVGVIAFTFDEIHPHDIAHVLGDRGVCIRVGHHCCMPLHKYLGVSATSRVSLSLYNDREDIDRLVNGLELVKKVFRKNAK